MIYDFLISCGARQTDQAEKQRHRHFVTVLSGRRPHCVAIDNFSVAEQAVHIEDDGQRHFRQGHGRDLNRFEQVTKSIPASVRNEVRLAIPLKIEGGCQVGVVDLGVGIGGNDGFGAVG